MTQKKGRKGLASVTPKNSRPIRSSDHLSMQEEARKTERHNDEWFTETKLRGKPVPFVSAGSLSTPELSSDQPTKSQTQDIAPVSQSLANLDLSHDQHASDRAQSPTSSTSSSDVVVFVGKDPEARKGVTKHVAALGWGSSSKPKHAKSNHSPNYFNEAKGVPVLLGCSSGEDVDEEIYRDYIENVGGPEALSELGDLGGKFAARPLTLGQDFGRLSDDEIDTGTDTYAAGSFSTLQTHQPQDFSTNAHAIVDQIIGDEMIARRLAERDASDDEDDSERDDAMLEADLDEEFDVMDFNRPSLQRRKKKGAHAIPSVLSDIELLGMLEQSWSTDRQKKKARKEEREELRRQGLLGGKKPHLNEKYTEGMRLEDIKFEFIHFCGSTHQTLSLPSMDKFNRKIVHEIAQSLGLKSKSTGSGDRRFVTLVKTRKSRGFDERTFVRIEQKIKGKFFPRQNKGGSRSNTTWGVGDGGAKYRDGDIVGGSAPEISADNRGRKMLGIMGWKDGEALGSSTNQGILQPIQHVVRNSRAGLG